MFCIRPSPLVVTAIPSDGQPTLWRRVRIDGSYLNAGDDWLYVGLRESYRVSSVTVEWPDGLHESFVGIAGVRLVSLKRGEWRPAGTVTR